MAVYHGLPPTIRIAAQKAFQKFSRHPAHPSLHLELLKFDGRAWSVRVTRNYRAVAPRYEDDWLWFWIGSHVAITSADTGNCVPNHPEWIKRFGEIHYPACWLANHAASFPPVFRWLGQIAPLLDLFQWTILIYAILYFSSGHSKNTNEKFADEYFNQQQQVPIVSAVETMNAINGLSED